MTSTPITRDEHSYPSQGYSEYSQPCDPRGLRRVRSARPTAAGPAPPPAASSAHRERVVGAGRAAVAGVLVVPRKERLGGCVRADDLANAVLMGYSEYSRGSLGTHMVPSCRARADDHAVLSGTHGVLTWYSLGSCGYSHGNSHGNSYGNSRGTHMGTVWILAGDNRVLMGARRWRTQTTNSRGSHRGTHRATHAGIASRKRIDSAFVCMRHEAPKERRPK